MDTVNAELRTELLSDKGGRTLSLVAATLNAGRRETIPAGDLRRLLTRFRRSAAAECAFSHLVWVIEELPPEQVHSLVVEGDATLPSLKRIVDYVGGEGNTAECLDEQLGAANTLA